MCSWSLFILALMVAVGPKAEQRFQSTLAMGLWQCSDHGLSTEWWLSLAEGSAR